MAGYSKIVADQFGGPDVLMLRQFDDLPEPHEGEVRVKMEVAGVGYTDTIVRRGRYIAYQGGLPLTPGYDLVGVVDKLGPGVTDFRIGDRVADMPVAGAYSQYVIRPAIDLVPVPANVDPSAAIEVPLMWMTAWQMLTRSAALHRDDQILVIGAGGAVGRSLVLLGRHLGLRVIGTTSAAKLSFVTSLGAKAIDYGHDDLASTIRSASTNGIDAIFDAMGGESWQRSWDVLANGGRLVGYGLQDFIESGGAPGEAATSLRLIAKDWNEAGQTDGSGRSSCFYDIRERRLTQPADYRTDAIHLLGLIAAGTVAPPPAQSMRLGEAADAHRLVAGGSLQTRLVLIP